MSADVRAELLALTDALGLAARQIDEVRNTGGLEDLTVSEQLVFVRGMTRILDALSAAADEGTASEGGPGWTGRRQPASLRGLAHVAGRARRDLYVLRDNLMRDVREGKVVSKEIPTK